MPLALAKIKLLFAEEEKLVPVRISLAICSILKLALSLAAIKATIALWVRRARIKLPLAMTTKIINKDIATSNSTIVKAFLEFGIWNLEFVILRSPIEKMVF